MCGFVGFVGDFSRTRLRAATRVLSHRGPDDEGLWCDHDGHVGLGHRRLSIQDTSHLGHQPMLSEDGQTSIAFNGEIYNSPELRRELEGEGWGFRSRSDTEVLLAMWSIYGRAMLDRLNGIFAFAIWDARCGSVFLARDALGVKPLYLARGSRGWVFASELKAILQMVPELVALDPVALHRYLGLIWCAGARTPLKGVEKVEPGGWVNLHLDGTEDRGSWYSPPTRSLAVAISGREAPDRVQQCLRTAVHRQMLSDVPVGAFLSGGLDSTSVAAFAREVDPALKCFTIQLDEGSGDGFAADLPYARLAAKHLGVPLEVVRIGSTDMASDLERMIFSLDEPLADPAALNVLYISRLAREHGVKVLLSGAGGDDLFSGYRRHRALRYDGVLAWFPGPVRRALAGLAPRMDSRDPFMRRAAKYLAGAELSGDARIANYFVWAQDSQLRGLYTRAFGEAVGPELPIAPLLEYLHQLPQGLDSLQRMLALEQRFFLPDHNLTYTDKMSMAVGVEARVPFLDRDLVELSWRIPSSLKQRGRVGKWVLKEAMRPLLPARIIDRPKTGFGAPVREWVRGELRELVQDTLSEEALLRRGMFDPSSVARLIRENEAGRVDSSYTILSLVCVEIWCRSFLHD
jgi:asparagine synthase (glutamine-hydrolysing)